MTELTEKTDLPVAGVPTLTPPTLTLRVITGEELRDAVPELARLRIAVFREFPYLYQGEQAYEEQYLRTYTQAPEAMAALALDGQQVVGATTALPMTHETPEVQCPFLNHSEFDLRDILYLGESVLLPAYRGQGLGHKFFDVREDYAQQLGLNVTTFCAVQRPEGHPLRPQPYRTLHAFWQARGYTERPDLTTELSWRDLGQEQESAKPMRFWVRKQRAT